MTLIKELIHIPEKVQRGDFVLNLASGLEADAIDQTLKDYVVTPQLAGCFEDALSFIKSGVAGGQNRNKGAYLHGSFGCGKSHFMAATPRRGPSRSWVRRWPGTAAGCRARTSCWCPTT